MSFISRIGDAALARWRVVRNIASVVWGVLGLAIVPANWPRTVREQAAKQMLFTGVDAIRLTMLIALLAGISIVVQAQLWLGRFGQSEMLGPLLVAVIIRETAPLLVSFVVIGRSGTAITTELANMRVRHEVDILDAQGIDPTVYLIMPRVIGVTFSVLCLAIFFVVGALGSGYLFAALTRIATEAPSAFARSVLMSISPADFLSFVAKTLVPGLIVGAVCSIEGLGITGSVTEVPQAATRGVVRSIVAVLVVSAVVSVFTYF